MAITTCSHAQGLSYQPYRYVVDVHRVVLLLWENSAVVKESGCELPGCLSNPSNDYETWNAKWTTKNGDEYQETFEFQIDSDGISTMMSPSQPISNLKDEQSLIGIALEIISQLINIGEWDYRETLKKVDSHISLRPFKYKADVAAQLFVNDLSDETMEVLQNFGPQAPFILNTYSCTLEDIAVEQLQKLKQLVLEIAELKGEDPDYTAVIGFLKRLQEAKPEPQAD